MPKRLAEMDGNHDETYSPVHELVAYVQAIHTELRGDCRRLAQQEGAETQQLLLERVGEHEEELRNALADTADEQRPEILETWIQYLPAEGVSARLEALCSAPLGGEDVVASVLEIHNQLADFCERLARQVSATQVQEFFASLANLERETGKQIATDVNSLREL